MHFVGITLHLLFALWEKIRQAFLIGWQSSHHVMTRGNDMTKQKEIYQAVGSRIFKIVFTKNNGDTREAYGQLFFDDRLVDDHPDTIAFVDFSVAAETFGTRVDDDGKPMMNNFRRAKLDKPFTIRCGDLVIKG